jgi:hypothetical protein
MERRNSAVEMTRTVSISGLGSEFDAFLFAPIGEERDGVLLSVLSALARLDVDPWQEAARLARLPVEAAAQRLASLIAALPEASGPRWDPETIANRLIGLLPRTAASRSPSSKTVIDVGAANRSQILVYVIVMVIALSVQLIAASHQPPAQVGDRNPPASSTLSPNTQTPPAHR